MSTSLDYIEKLGPVFTAYAYVDLFYSSAAIFIISMTLYKMDFMKFRGYSSIILVSFLVSWILNLSTGVVSTNSWMNVETVQYLQTCGFSFAEFSFSIVNLSLKSLCNIFAMKSSGIEIGWLLFNLSQVVVNVIFVKLNVTYGNPIILLYWNQIVTFSMQLLNLGFFAYHMHYVAKLLRASPIKGKSRGQVLETLGRFETFMSMYIFHCIAQFFMCVATIADNSMTFNENFANLTLIATMMVGGTRFYAFFQAMQIFRPRLLNFLNYKYASIIEESWILRTHTEIDNQVGLGGGFDRAGADELPIPQHEVAVVEQRTRSGIEKYMEKKSHDSNKMVITIHDEEVGGYDEMNVDSQELDSVKKGSIMCVTECP